jgi:hypothetical protein
VRRRRRDAEQACEEALPMLANDFVAAGVATSWRAGARMLRDNRAVTEPRSYSLEEARALVPEVRAVLLQLALLVRRGNGAQDDIEALLEHLGSLGVQLRDLQQGLVDFPSQRDGRPIWLCWRLSDPELAHWHGTDEGFSSRKPC